MVIKKLKIKFLSVHINQTKNNKRTISQKDTERVSFKRKNMLNIPTNKIPKETFKIFLGKAILIFVFLGRSKEFNILQYNPPDKISFLQY